MKTSGGKLLTVLKGGCVTADQYLQNVLQPVMWLPIREVSGTISKNVMYEDPPGPELLTNPYFEDWSGGAPVGWVVTQSPPNSEITEDPTDTLRLVSDGTVGHVLQSVMTLGDTYQLGVNIAQVLSGLIGYGVAATGPTVNLGSAGPSSQRAVAQDTRFIINRNIGGTDARVNSGTCRKIGEMDGVNNGPTLASGTFMGFPCPRYDGSNDYTQLEWRRLQDKFDPTQGSIGIGLYLSQAQWQDANSYCALTLGVDASNRLLIRKSSANNLRCQITAGGSNNNADYTVTAADYDRWLYVIFTWDSVDGMNAYIKPGKSVSATYPGATWAGSLAEVTTRIGTISNVNFWPNYLASCFLTDYVIEPQIVNNLQVLARAQGLAAGEVWAA